MYMIQYRRPQDDAWQTFERAEYENHQIVEWASVFKTYQAAEREFDHMNSANQGPVAIRILRVEVMKTGGRV
jgi:hypothetical protein